MLQAMPTAGDCLVGLPPERYGADVARLRRIFLLLLGWFLIDIKYGATVAHLHRNFFGFFSRCLVGEWLPRLAQRRYGATVARLRRIFFDACWIHIMFFYLVNQDSGTAGKGR
jgi:hypothetical protein